MSGLQRAAAPRRGVDVGGTLDAIVADYLARNAGCDPCCGEDLEGFAELPDIGTAIHRAVLCLTSLDRRHPHQRRLPLAVLRQGEQVLQSLAGRMEAATSFDDLHDVVAGALAAVPGIGALTDYDIATRIGAFLRLAPTSVYLHAGTAVGAQAFGVRSRPDVPVERDRFPPPLCDLPAADIENLLCIYKDRLKRLPADDRQ